MTHFDDYDRYTIDRCRNYIWNHRLVYGWERQDNDVDYLMGLNTNQLKWNDGKNWDTYTWCKFYILKHTGYLPGGSKSRKQQSKRKNLRLRKVSKKY